MSWNAQVSRRRVRAPRHARTRRGPTRSSRPASGSGSRCVSRNPAAPSGTRTATRSRRTARPTPPGVPAQVRAPGAAARARRGLRLLHGELAGGRGDLRGGARAWDLARRSASIQNWNTNGFHLDLRPADHFTLSGGEPRKVWIAHPESGRYNYLPTVAERVRFMRPFAS